MNDTAALLARATAFTTRTGKSAKWISKRLFNDWRRLEQIAGGKSFPRPPTLTAALERLSALERDLENGGSRSRNLSTPASKGASDGEHVEGQQGAEETPEGRRRAQG